MARLLARIGRLSILLVISGQLLGSGGSAQEVGSWGSLGGYGGSILNMGEGKVGGGPVLPYGGSFTGFMPYRMARGGNLGFEARSGAFMPQARSSLSLAPMASASILPQASGMGRGSSPPAGGGVGSSMNGISRTQGSAGMGSGVMPPNLGYPFRPPTRLLRPGRPGVGMSM